VRGQRRHAPAADAVGTGSALTSTRRPEPNRRLRANAVRPGRSSIGRAGAIRPSPALAAAARRRDAQHLGDQPARIAALRLAALGLARPDAKLALLAHGRAAFRRKRPWCRSAR
jgi:hypothetical protein